MEILSDSMVDRFRIARESWHVSKFSERGERTLSLRLQGVKGSHLPVVEFPTTPRKKKVNVMCGQVEILFWVL